MSNHVSPCPSVPAAVLWDMDGTIVDTEPYWVECEYEVIARHGNGAWSQAHVERLVGSDLLEAAGYMIEHGDLTLGPVEVVNLLLDGVIERVKAHIPWRPGARELLAELNEQAVPCALVTMSWRRFAQAIVAALPPGSFATVVAGDDVERGKPHPDPYLVAAERLGVSAAECVAIEDSPTGVRSAVAARCITIGVPNVVGIPPDLGHVPLDTLDGVSVGTLARIVDGVTTTRRPSSA
ncbi:MAG: HAD family phosphatase [Ilumatobacteraceae bacterium]